MEVAGVIMLRVKLYGLNFTLFSELQMNKVSSESKSFSQLFWSTFWARLYINYALQFNSFSILAHGPVQTGPSFSYIVILLWLSL